LPESDLDVQQSKHRGLGLMSKSDLSGKTKSDQFSSIC
jgi:hypothetical protein